MLASRPLPGFDLNACLERLARHEQDAGGCLEAVRELLRFAPVLASDLDIDSKQQAIAGLRATLGAGSREVLEAAFVALAHIDRPAATTAGFVMFARLGGQMQGLASGLLARLVPPNPPTVEHCLAWLAGEDNLRGLLAAEALGEQGPGAVARLLVNLQRLLGGPRGSSEERVRGRIAHALGRIGPGAAAAIPMLLRLLDDEHVYRDTRWYAKRALVAIGPEAAVALLAELRATPRWVVLEALSEMRPEALADLVGLAGHLEALRSGEDSGLHGISAAILHKLR
ncbi:MAG: HEAT repeat domain-containing protein [Nannocystis sp.]|nr:HEAT repeat domain-containing protein [Nannocystis sp.]MBA3544915.1 HEAT repeat domain-containing protein [Nannocystis sp.]